MTAEVIMCVEDAETVHGLRCNTVAASIKPAESGTQSQEGYAQAADASDL